MTPVIQNTVPWGRSFREYRAMFALDETDLGKRILGCGDGPAGFNAKITRRGGICVSIDPLYAATREEIATKIDAARPQVLEHARQQQDQFVWTHIKTLEELDHIRTEAMDAFLADFDQGKAEGRYIEGELPVLPFADEAFDIALCSHFLFLYSEQYDADFHIRSLLELARAAIEVRVFPLITLDGKPSPHLKSCMSGMKREGYTCTIKPVAYEFQKGGNEMLHITGGP